MVERFVSIEEAAGSMPAFSTFQLFLIRIGALRVIFASCTVGKQFRGQRNQEQCLSVGSVLVCIN